MPDEWPPAFSLDQERILKLLTGDRFYSNPSAALREAVLNAIDAIHRRRRTEPSLVPDIAVAFDRENRTLVVADNGVGMSRDEVRELFTKVGASAAAADAGDSTVGEFGIGVVSYFMAGDRFDLETNDGDGAPIGLCFTREMLAGQGATDIPPSQPDQGTRLTIHIRDDETFDLLLEKFPHWCRDVEGLSARLYPEDQVLTQGGAHRAEATIEVEHPAWVEATHLGPVSEPTGWNAMTGDSTVAVLYRGVFVQEFSVTGAWGIEGSIDVDPKHFKPRLNREGFVEGEFQSQVGSFLKDCHPKILQAMAGRLAKAVRTGQLDEWTEKQWANLWLSVPRTAPYKATVREWDEVFRSLPAFELAVGDKWEAVPLERLMGAEDEIFVAPLPRHAQSDDDVVIAALRFLRNTGRTVIRGIRGNPSWMRQASFAFSTTADLITSVFSSELPPLTPIVREAENILDEIDPIAPLFTGPPNVDLVRLGKESPPALRIQKRLLINTDHPSGEALVRESLRENTGARSLIAIAAKHAYEQLTQVAAVARNSSGEPEVLSPVRRQFIRSHLP